MRWTLSNSSRPSLKITEWCNKKNTVNWYQSTLNCGIKILCSPIGLLNMKEYYISWAHYPMHIKHSWIISYENCKLQFDKILILTRLWIGKTWRQTLKVWLLKESNLKVYTLTTLAHKEAICRFQCSSWSSLFDNFRFCFA